MSAKIDSSVELLILEMQNAKLYGEVTVKFEAGHVVLIKRIESIKPADYRSTRSEGE